MQKKLQNQNLTDFESELLGKLDQIIDLLGEPKQGKSKPHLKGQGTLVWEAYSLAFRKKYHEDPVRNARGNSLCSTLVTRLGQEAPLVASFYLTHTDAVYTRSRHDLSLLIRDAEKLRLEWKTGHAMTGREAREDEFSGSVRSQLNRIERGEV